MCCANCKKQAYLYCGKCKYTMYCSKECQVFNWPKHKEKCKKYSKCNIINRLDKLARLCLNPIYIYTNSDALDKYHYCTLSNIKPKIHESLENYDTYYIFNNSILCRNIKRSKNIKYDKNSYLVLINKNEI